MIGVIQILMSYLIGFNQKAMIRYWSKFTDTCVHNRLKYFPKMGSVEFSDVEIAVFISR